MKTKDLILLENKLLRSESLHTVIYSIDRLERTGARTPCQRFFFPNIPSKKLLIRTNESLIEIFGVRENVKAINSGKRIENILERFRKTSDK